MNCRLTNKKKKRKHQNLEKANCLFKRVIRRSIFESVLTECFVCEVLSMRGTVVLTNDGIFVCLFVNERSSDQCGGRLVLNNGYILCKIGKKEMLSYGNDTEK